MAPGERADSAEEEMMFSTSVFSHLEFPPGVKLLQALDRLLSVHHGGHCRALLRGDENKASKEER